MLRRLLILLLLIPGALATDYYYSNSGDDARDCSTPALACKTIGDLNGKALSAGDTVYFNRGDIWHMGDDTFLDVDSGSAAGNVTYTAYGTGERPILAGSYNLSNTANWTNSGAGNIWNGTFTVTTEMGSMTLNHDTLQGVPNGDYSLLNTQGEFYYNPPTDKIAMYSTSNPATYYSEVIAGMDDNVIDINSKSYVVFRDLHIKYSARCGIEGASSHHVYMINNSFSFIGGAYQSGTLRYGNAIQFWANAHDNYVEYNDFYQIYDAAITNQQSNTAPATAYNIFWRYNTITKVRYCYEFFISNTSSTVYNIVFDHNTCVNDGPNLYHTVDGYTRLSRIIVGATGINFTNNIYYNESYLAWELGSNSANNWKSDIFFDWNYYYKNPSATDLMDYNNTHYSTLAAFQAAKSKDTNSYQAPNSTLFTDIVARDYRPVYNSEACTMSSTGSYVGALPCADAPEEETIVYYTPTIHFSGFALRFRGGALII